MKRNDFNHRHNDRLLPLRQPGQKEARAGTVPALRKRIITVTIVMKRRIVEIFGQPLNAQAFSNDSLRYPFNPSLN